MAEISATIPLLMSFDLEQMLKSKEAFRERLARLPIGEKLRLLDALRERALAIRESNDRASIVVGEESPQYPTRKDKTDE
jgi:hypothetical protein